MTTWAFLRNIKSRTTRYPYSIYPGIYFQGERHKWTSKPFRPNLRYVLRAYCRSGWWACFGTESH